MSHRVNVVGPICETADQLGADRWLPQTTGRRRTSHRDLRSLRLRHGLAL